MSITAYRVRHKLHVQKLSPGARTPEVAHQGEDLAYDLFALEDTILPYGEVVKVATGIAATAYSDTVFEERSDFMGISGSMALRTARVISEEKLGLLIRDRSSMASKGITTSGGVIDAGYTGEISVMMTNNYKHHTREYIFHGTERDSVEKERAYVIKKGDKIAQMMPVRVLTGEVFEVDTLEEGLRGGSGFGSTGR